MGPSNTCPPGMSERPPFLKTRKVVSFELISESYEPFIFIQEQLQCHISIRGGLSFMLRFETHDRLGFCLALVSQRVEGLIREDLR